ncbi:hypothetical protein HSR121_1789 [Halapricum desulfuricans]|uniref:Uncharacterized protein n=1 Tax=Halapricum desulfuricans TaxID=2841257 RepID=A0A897N0B0_9EURY|nr:hypothetical protein HSR121_1789 [Halapricum desulfuricans]
MVVCSVCSRWWRYLDDPAPVQLSQRGVGTASIVAFGPVPIWLSRVVR